MNDYFLVALDLLSSRKPVDSMTSVYLMLFIQNKSSLADMEAFKMSLNTNSKNSFKSLSLFLVESVLCEFKRHCEIAKHNLLLAALQKPVYGPLAAIRNLIIQSANEYLNIFKNQIHYLI